MFTKGYKKLYQFLVKTLGSRHEATIHGHKYAFWNTNYTQTINIVSPLGADIIHDHAKASMWKFWQNQ